MQTKHTEAVKSNAGFIHSSPSLLQIMVDSFFKGRHMSTLRRDKTNGN